MPRRAYASAASDVYQDLFGEGGARTRHTYHEDRRAGVVSCPRLPLHQFTVKNRSDALEGAEDKLLIILQLPPLEHISLAQMVKRPFVLAQVFIGLAEREV